MTARRVYSAPTFSQVETTKELLTIEKEIRKLSPIAEVSIEGMSEVASGRIKEWNPDRKLFTIEWKKKSTAFDEKTGSQTGLRAFFKVKLFSTQIVFKTTTVRRLEDGTYHYRIPAEIFKQQRRGALRVPIQEGSAFLQSFEGTFEILDLSVSGAKLKGIETVIPPRLNRCRIKLGKQVTGNGFEAQITHRGKTQVGCKFEGIDEPSQTEIKQFLLEALRQFYEKGLSS